MCLKGSLTGEYKISSSLSETFGRVNAAKIEFIHKQLELVVRRYNRISMVLTSLDRVLFGRYLEDIDAVCRLFFLYILQ